PKASIAGGWMAELVYAANPNLLYLQTTAMTEALSLALAIWALVFYAEFVSSLEDWRRIELSVPQRDLAEIQACHRLEWLAITLGAGMLTRYDAWMLTVAVWIAVWWHLRRESAASLHRASQRFFLLTALVPLLWLAY